MERKEPKLVNEFVFDFLRETELLQPFLEHQIVNFWTEVVGKYATKDSDDLKVKQGVLHVRITNAALKNEIFNMRYELVKKLNDKVGSKVINDIRLL